MIDLGRIGLWTYQLDLQPSPVAIESAAEIERLGYRALWISDSTRRDVVGNAWLMLDATNELVVATGVANIYSRDPTAMRMAQLTLCERFPDRFVLGLGVSHRSIVETARGHQYGPPLATMRGYLDGLAQVDYLGVPPAGETPVLLAALGPKMIELARERTAGIHPYHTTPAHTRQARELLGDGPFLAPEQSVVIDRDIARARDIARTRLKGTFRHPSYLANLERMGFTEADIDGGGSDRLVDALVACGEPDRVIERIQQHLDAGADHVAVQVMVGDDKALPFDLWRQLAQAAGRTGLM